MSTRAPYRRGSTGTSGPGDRARTYWTNQKPDKVPHYLRASTGSCHDTCKYGGHREATTRKPLQKIWPKSAPNVVNSVEMVDAKKGSCNGGKMALTDKRATKPSLMHSHGVQGKRQQYGDAKTGRNVATSKKTSVSLKARENGRLKLSRQDQKWMHGDEIEPSNSLDSEKTLHAINTTNAIPASPSPNKDSEAIKHCPNNETSRNQQVETLMNQKAVIPERLGFRTTSVINEDENDKDDDASESDIVKLNLKHQQVERTKESQCSLNTLIEETAKKLVLSRKSKVKALVGAFETVISIQEGKTSFHYVR